MPKLATKPQTTKVGTPHNLKDAVPPSELAGLQFQIDCIVDAINFHENGDDEDAACCTGDNPCDTRTWLVGQHRQISDQIRERTPGGVPDLLDEDEIQTPGAGGSGSATRPGPVVKLASEKSIAWALKLAEIRSTDRLMSFKLQTLADLREGKDVSQRRVSALIDFLKDEPRAQVRPEVQEIRTPQPQIQQGPAVPKFRAPVTEDGLYQTPEGELYKVQIAHHGSGRLYAKKLVKLDEPIQMKRTVRTHEFVKETGALRKLTPDMRLTLEQAKQLGRDPESELYGSCCVCGTILTNETSIAEGIGPKCGNRV